MNQQIFDLRLQTPSTIILSGPSQCGKTTLIESLITEAGVFDKQFSEIQWVHAQHAKNSQLFERLSNQLPISFHEGLSSVDLNNVFNSNNSVHKLLVLDDILTEPVSCAPILELFNITSHHKNITVILTVQNLYGCTPAQRSCLSTLLRSCAYLVLFACRRMIPVVRSIATAYFPGEQIRVLGPFNELLRQAEQHRYLVLDFVTNDENLRIREGGLVPSQSCYIFANEEN
jgi:hypothetical protein